MYLPITAQSENLGMNTVMMHKAFGKHAEEALRAVRDEAVRLEELLSRYIPGSEISRINNSAGFKCEKLSGETYEVLSRAAQLSRYCQGFFDVTIGPLVDLWSSTRDTLKPPEESRIRQVIPLVNFADLVLDPFKMTAGLRRTGQSIDLGGIGKGFTGDKLLEVLKKYEILSAFTNIGGNVTALGTKPDGSPWRVGIQHPRKENKLIGLVAVADKAVVTSGDYQRYFIGSKGKRYHHILNPNTGYPTESGLISVTIVADSSMTADALSTILFITGMKKGIEFLKAFPGTEAILIDINLRCYVTRGLKDHFQGTEGIQMNILDN